MPCRSLLSVLVLLAFVVPGVAGDIHAGPSDAPQTNITQGDLSDKRGQLELMKIEVLLEREKQELEKLRKKPAPVSVRPVQVAPRPAKPEPRPVVISIQSAEGAGGALTATLMSRKGMLTVKKGDRVLGGVVESIQTNRVVMRFHGKSEPLLFQE